MSQMRKEGEKLASRPGEGAGRLRVVYIQRKPRAHGNFSLEFIFDDVRRRLSREIEGVTHVVPFLSNGVFRRLAIALDAALHQGDINHVTGDINFATLFLRRRKTVLTILDCTFMKNRQGLQYWVLKTFWLSLPVMRTRFVTTISEAARQDIIAYTKCDPAKVRVVPVAISEGFVFQPKPFNADCPRILQIGTGGNKNVHRLVEALEGISCVLEIVGVVDARLEKKLKEHGIKYESRAMLPQEELLKSYAVSDMIAFVSTYEGFGMPILEANAVGRPVVTSEVSSMPEVAGDAACLVDPHEVQSIRSGILKVIKDAEYRELLVRNGQENVKRFDPDRIAREYLEVYKSVLEGRAG